MRYLPFFALMGLALPTSLTLAPGAVAQDTPPAQVTMASKATLCRLDGTVWDHATGHPSTDQIKQSYCRGLRAGENRGKQDGQECHQKSYGLWYPDPNDAQRAWDRGYKNGYDRAYQREWNNNSCQNRPQPEPYYPPLH